MRGPAPQGVSAYDADYVAVGHAKRLADHFGVAVVLVHHVRKAGSEDFLTEVSGTNGIAGAADGVPMALGPILGGAITTGISWRGVFWIDIPIGVIALVISLRAIPESRSRQSHRPDWAGFATLTVSLVSLVYGLIRAGEQGWGDGLVFGCLGAAVVLLVAFVVAFVVAETQVAHPMFGLGLLRIPTFLGGSVAAFAMNGSLFSILLYLTLYLQDGLGYSALQTGLRLLLMSGVTMVVATVAGRVSSHLPVRRLMGPGLVIIGVALFLMSGLDATSDWTHLIPGLLVSGVGAGLAHSVTSSG
jgi:predicted MFS family arabinose efflux permease